MEPYKSLKNKIKDKSCVIGVLGLGYVGLPIATLFASRGFEVRGGDINEKIVNTIMQGRSPIEENGLQELVGRVTRDRKLTATTDVNDVVRHSDVIFIVVPTPVNEKKEPDLNAVKTACMSVGKNLEKGKLVIIESTIPPGTTREIVVPILKKSGLKAGVDFYLAYSPERAIPTKTLEEMQENGRVIGGINRISAELASMVYAQVVKGEIITEEVGIVEMVKVIENTYRDVNIALANEIALLGERLGIDATRAIELANRHPRVHLHKPGAGVGGHCIPKDPYFLLDRARKLGIKLKVISAAREINESMPAHVLELIEKSLVSVNKDMRDAKISILGLAYKGNTDDIRGTPSEIIVKTLLREKCNVFSHDPYISQDFGGKFSNNLDEAIEGSDCVVIVTDHDEYKNMNLGKFARQLKKPSVIVDARRILNPKEVEKRGISYFGVGM